MYLSKLKLKYADLSTVDDEIIQSALDDAADQVSNEDITDDDPYYDKMQAAWAAHLLHLDGYLKTPVVSERVGDVGITYHDSQFRDNYADQWERLYYRLRANAQGYSSNISDTHGLPLW
jgi:hypothetical protein